MPIQLPGFAGGDRTSIDLPAAQEELLKALIATGKPVVVVLQNGSALAVNYAAEHAAAILEAWYPGEEGGTAIAETLAGQNNPGGRLPITIYHSTEQLPAFDDYRMQGRTYRYFTQQPLFAFGSGLSYTKFSYGDVKTSTTTAGAIEVRGTVTNTGSVAGDEVAEVYLQQPKADLTPRLTLAAFKRVHLAPGESRSLTFALDPRTLSQVDATGARAVLPGTYRVSMGGAQPDTASFGGTTFTVSQKQDLPR